MSERSSRRVNVPVSPRTSTSVPARVVAPSRAPGGTDPGRSATLDTGIGPGAITFEARTPGTAGNSITVALIASGAAGSGVSVGVAGNAVTITAAADATVGDVIDAVNASANAPVRARGVNRQASPLTIAATNLANGRAGV
jgi:hypothetical protein